MPPKRALSSGTSISDLTIPLLKSELQKEGTDHSKCKKKAEFVALLESTRKKQKVEKEESLKDETSSNDAPSFVFFPFSKISEEITKECVEVFNSNYGIWGELAEQSSTFLKKGSRVKLSSKRLHQQCVFDGSCGLMTATLGGKIIGYAFFASWKMEEVPVCWITQLVVSSEFRRRNIASALMLHITFRFKSNTIFGLVSSHPAAVLALSKFAKINLQFIGEFAAKIIATSSVSYLKEAVLHGSLFDGATDGSVSSVNTNFFVDHAEPLSALTQVQKSTNWILGELMEGHEFFVAVRKQK